jgi:concanavalin A-like lectin/glucanase superfamily protein
MRFSSGFNYTFSLIICGLVCMFLEAEAITQDKVDKEANQGTNYALSLDGDVGYLEVKRCGNITNYNISRTVELWFKPEKTDLCLISTGDTCETGAPLWLIRTDKHGRLYVYHGQEYFTGKEKAEIGTWNHAAFTYSRGGDILRIYLNGKLQIAVPYRDKKNGENENIYIGASHGGYFVGEIDEVRIWRRALSGEEIKKNMNRALTGKEKNLVCYWNFNNGSTLSAGYRAKHGIRIGSIKFIKTTFPWSKE